MSTPQLRPRRWTALAAAAAATTLVLAACGGGDSAEGDDGSITLRVGWYGGDPLHAALEETLDRYEQDNPGVTIEVSRAAFADYFDRLATETAGRSGPDVTRMSMSYFADYAGRGALQALDEYVGETIVTDGLDTDVQDSGVLNDEYFGVPQSVISHALLTDPELLATLGAEAPAPDWTWEQYADWAKGIGQANPGFYGSSDMGGQLQAFEVWVRQHGSELFSDDGTGLAFDQSVLEDWWTYWQSMRDESGAPPPDITAESDTFETSVLTQGLAPATYVFVQQISFFQALNEHTLELQPMPVTDGGDPGQFLKALDFWSVSSTSEHPDEAAELIDYLVNDPQAVEAIGLTLGVPPSQEARDVLAADPATPEGKAIAYVESLGDDRVGPPPGPWPRGYGELLALFTKLSEDIAFGATDIGAASEQFFAEADRVLEGF
ncbi:ABC transporter substrate-binding protein [Jiangella endophytica]|uniref:ABC transporter substrate-binding protein n=1 Tax=Jiangella endophytica TaxID=1623398 RepID=UPI00130028AC|nr:extracellular solute-binding protein [Jiangella endophytica]